MANSIRDTTAGKARLAGLFSGTLSEFIAIRRQPRERGQRIRCRVVLQ